ncbi:TPA: YkgJ family cysteine cluster protein, partial [Vibrio diabolicus]
DIITYEKAMRKVKPEDEIPSNELTYEAQQNRLTSFTTSHQSNVELTKLRNWLIANHNVASHKEILEALCDGADLHYRNDISPVSVCRKGCGYCCKTSVLITRTEAERISSTTGKTLNNLEDSCMADTNDGLMDTYCPFFDTDSAGCSVYSARPLVCRIQATIDHYEYCRDGGEHLMIRLGDGEPFAMGMKLLAQKLLDEEKSGNGAAISDIRNWFV